MVHGSGKDLAEKLMVELRDRFVFDISKGSLFNFKRDVEIITLENLEQALKRILEDLYYYEMKER